MNDSGRCRRDTDTPCTVISGDFSLLGQLQRGHMLNISRVIPHLQSSLTAEEEGELLAIDVSVASRERVAAFLAEVGGFAACFLLVRDEAEVSRWSDFDAVAVSVSDWLQGLPDHDGASDRAPVGASSTFPLMRNQTLVVFSPKGGVGRTTVAVNLACRARSALGLEVVLVDLDIGGGDAAVHLNLVEEPTIIDLAAYGEDLNPEQVREFAAVHRESGLHLLSAPGRPELVELAPWHNLAPVVRTCQRAYDLVVIDTPGDPASEVSYRSLETASYILAPVLPDVCSPRRVSVALRTMEELQPGWGDEVRMVLNRHYDGAPVGEADLRRSVQRPVVASFPESTGVLVEAVSAGRPPVMRGGEDGIRNAADAVLEDAFGVSVRAENSSWWHRLARRLTGLRGRG